MLNSTASFGLGAVESLRVLERKVRGG
ncbi:MAG: hypothetical protein FWC72_08465 [Oscillospiraceae bacterium]|nr:hypothetical protein [Oscillospiraceae bacterium]